jgi:DNA repair protein RadC
MRERFEKNGFTGFADHEVLEYLLFYAIARGDTNDVAHRLIKRFGSIRAVFDAPVNELMKLNGIGAHSAYLIKMVPELAKLYAQSGLGPGAVSTTEDAAGLLAPKFFGLSEECVALLCLDNRRNPKFCDILYKGSVNAVDVNVRLLIEKILVTDSVGVVLAHNHPNGIALPSEHDIATTVRIKDYLKGINVTLVDHLVMVEGDYISMAESGFLDDGYTIRRDIYRSELDFE